MINGPAGGDFEECGDTTTGLSMAFNQLTVVFRYIYSEVVRDVGFEKYGLCFKQAETSLSGTKLD